jgi:hypothetical protein
VTVIPFTNAGHISRKESALNALTEWANSCERKAIIGLSCGVVLPRQRHRAWAAERLQDAKHAVRGKCGRGFILLAEREKAGEL